MFELFLCLLGVTALTMCCGYMTWCCFNFVLETKIVAEPLPYIFVFLMSVVFGVLTLFFLELVWITLQVIFN